MHLAGGRLRIAVVLVLIRPRLTPPTAILRPALPRLGVRPAGLLAAVSPACVRLASTVAATASAATWRARGVRLVAVTGPASVVAALVASGRPVVAS